MTIDDQELRLATVMTGGVSLAVWMGGATHEINRLVRGRHETYRGLLALTRSVATVDVITGTSAGGLNGAVLGMARAFDADIQLLRQVWMDTAGFDKLLRSPLAADPPSILRGEYFLSEIETALGALQQSGSAHPAPRLDLVVTGTLLNGSHLGFPDSFGSVVRDVEHRAEFTFRRGDGRDDFRGDVARRQLALAARSSASFPVAFEPTFCAIDGGGPGPDMTGPASFAVSRWVIDGGVLVNKPLAPALAAIFAQPAEGQVRRVLLYVVPDPGESGTQEPDDPEEIPTLANVALASLVRIPGNQSVASELERIAEQNSRVAAQRRRRELAATLDVRGTAKLENLARTLYPAYQRVRAERIADQILSLVAHGSAQAGTTTGPELPDRVALRDAMRPRLDALPPDAFPAAGEPVTEWFTTPDTVERAGVVVLDLLRRGLGLAPPDETVLREQIATRRGELHRCLAAARRARPMLGPEERLELAADAARAPRDAAQLADWTDDLLTRALGPSTQFGEIIREIADLLPDAAELALEAYRLADASQEAYYEGTEMLARGLSLSDAERRTPDAALRRLLALEVVEVALGESPVREQAVELLQLSADTPNSFDGRDRATSKLTGLQLGHFGAFYKRSWRANDWLWGRLDAAERLVSVLLEPFRLRQLDLDPETVADTIVALATGPTSDRDQQAYLSELVDRDAIVDELAFIQNAEPLPETLPRCIRAVSRRLQLDILRDELPRLAVDQAIDAQRPGEPRIDPGMRPVRPAEAVSRFQGMRIGQERIQDEVNTDGFALRLSQATAVTTSAIGGVHAGLGSDRLPFGRPLRWGGLSTFLATDAVVRNGNVGRATTFAALAASGAIVVLAFFATLPSIVLAIAAGVLLAGLLLAFVRARIKEAVAALLAGAVLALAPRVILEILGTDDKRTWELLRRYEPAWGLLAIAAASVLVGALVMLWGRKRKRPPTGENLTEAEWQQLMHRVARIDDANGGGRWSSDVLRLIGNHPGRRLDPIAARTSTPTPPRGLRRLEHEGLIQRRGAGYVLSPRGRAYVQRTSTPVPA